MRKGADVNMSKMERQRIIAVYVSEDEYVCIREKMEHMGYQVLSKYARKMMLDGHASAISYLEMERQSERINIILKTVNHLVEQVHATSISQDKEIAEIKLALSEIWRLEQYNISKLRVV